MKRESHKIREWCEGVKVIPSLSITKIEDAVPLVGALVDGGIRVVEITLRSPCALDAITKLKDSFAEDQLKVAAGTVRTNADVFAAKRHKADFAMSLGTTLQLLDSAFDAMLPIMPGVSTPSEVMQWNEYGLDFFKFFPAEQSGGIAKLESFLAPLPDIAFCPTGKVKPETVRAYLNLSNVICVGGSWLDSRHCASGNWQEITKLAREAMKL